MDEQLNSHKLNFLSGLLTNDLVAQFKWCRNDEERFKLALEVVIRNSAILFDSDCECKEKDSERSVRSREDGNRSFVDNRYYEAVQEYTESIVYAVESSEELSLAYANRSAALFKLEKFEECIKDIDRALSLEYPDRLKTKLYKRKGLCLTKLGRSGADSSFEEALLWVDKTNLSHAETNKSRNELRKLILTPSTGARPRKNAKNVKFPLPQISTPNPEIPCASDGVAIKYSEKFGRHLVATREIKPGEILILEKPYCLRLSPNNVYKYCSYCLRVSWDLIPCKCCVNVAYCSDTCKDKAWDEYHEVECPILGLLLEFKFNNVVGISVRTAIMAIRKAMNLRALKEELTNVDRGTDPRMKGFSVDGKFHSDRYHSVYSLANNVDKCTAGELVVRALWVAIAVCTLARDTKIFQKNLILDTLARNPDVIFVGGLILKLVHIVYINTDSFGASRSLSTNEHGSALMAVSSLLNHSCDANTIKQWYGDRMAFYAVYPIKTGEQLFDNYGPRSSKMVKSERHGHFKRWNFNCDCRPCTENWPLLEHVPSYKTQPLSHQNKSKLDKVVRKLRTRNTSMLKGILNNSPTVLNEILETIELLFQLAQRPCAELVLVRSMLKD